MKRERPLWAPWAAGLLFVGNLCIMAALVAWPTPTSKSVAGLLASEAGQPPTRVVFFGYTGCGTICPTALMALGKMMDQAEAAGVETEVLFVELRPETPPALVAQYARAFHPGIITQVASEENLPKLLTDFGVTWDPETPGDPTHSGWIYFLNPGPAAGAWTLRRIYRNATPDADSLLSTLMDISIPG